MVDKRAPGKKTKRISADKKAKLIKRTRSLLEASAALKQKVADSHADTIVAMAELIFKSLSQGGKVMLCGNGGSAADAQHLAAELLVRLRPFVNRAGVPAIALATDVSSLTACANDFCFEVYYERQTCALGRPGDILIGITTTGKSPNIVRALHAAREGGIVAMGLLGGSGGPALKECDLALVVPSSVTAHIQECHITIGHAIIELVEDLLLECGHLKQVK